MVITAEKTIIRNASWWQKRTDLERRIIGLLIGVLLLSIGLIVALGVLLGTRTECAKTINDDTDRICITSGCNNTAEKLLQDMDLTTHPCEDFYQFACGGFLEKTVLRDQDYVVDHYTVLEDMIQGQLKEFIEEPSKPNEIKPFVLLKKLYNTCMNTAAIENDGLGVINSILKDLGGWPVLEGNNWNEGQFDWKTVIYKMRTLGISVEFLIGFYVTPDQKNMSRQLISLEGPEIGLHEVYLVQGLINERVRAYYEYMVDIAVLMGAPRMYAHEQLMKSLEFEIEIAKLYPTFEELRNLTALYNPMTIREMQHKFPNIPWLEYINNVLGLPAIKLSEDDTVDVSMPDYIKGVIPLIERTPKRVLANYLAWRVVAYAVPFLTEELRNRKYEFDEFIDGAKDTKPRWRKCLTHAYYAMHVALEAIYVKNKSNRNTKHNVYEIVSNIKNQFENLLKGTIWMDEETKENALAKVGTMTTHVAYPDELLDDEKLEQLYSKLEFKTENYLKLILTLSLFDTDYYWGQLWEPFNKTDWVRHSFPTSVESYYKFGENSIRFPAGLLQGVFFDNDRPQYMNYGSIGYLIGHEITHGFDVEGSQYDKDGNLNNWWANDTKRIFEEKAQCIIDQYGNYTVPEINLHLNGFNTQEENIADNGGIRIAYSAYQAWSEQNKMEPQLVGLDYTPSQMFWISAAHTWCAKYRDEFLKGMVMTNRHSPSRYRIWGPFGNSKYFSNDFNCPAGSAMNRKNKCRVW